MLIQYEPRRPDRHPGGDRRAQERSRVGYLGLDVYEEEAGLFSEDLSDEIVPGRCSHAFAHLSERDRHRSPGLTSPRTRCALSPRVTLANVRRLSSAARSRATKSAWSESEAEPLGAPAPRRHRRSRRWNLVGRRLSPRRARSRLRRRVRPGQHRDVVQHVARRRINLAAIDPELGAPASASAAPLVTPAARNLDQGPHPSSRPRSVRRRAR